MKNPGRLELYANEDAKRKCETSKMKGKTRFLFEHVQKRAGFMRFERGGGEIAACFRYAILSNPK
jgi:hypothetical protein